MNTPPKPYVITVVGPESSGKTTLTRQLAQLTGCAWVPEYARNYIADLNRPYTESDLAKIAQGQMEAITDALDQASKAVTAPDIEKAFNALVEQTTGLRMSDSVLWFPLTAFGAHPRKVIIVDNGLLSIQLWAEIKYGSTAPMIEDAFAEKKTDLYVLCRPVLPWEPDPQREAPALLDRAWIYNQFLDRLIKLKKKSNPG